MVATYYNPAYRPALEEELSSTDVKHAALSSRCCYTLTTPPWSHKTLQLCILNLRH